MSSYAATHRHSFTDDWADGQTHSLLVGYALWLFGFLGAHRFYYGTFANCVVCLVA